MKIAQEYPELYDGYMIAQPALSIPLFGTAALYPQIVMKTELGFTAANKAEAAAFATKVDAANKRAVGACDKAGLGFLLDPFACDYDPRVTPACYAPAWPARASLAATPMRPLHEP